MLFVQSHTPFVHTPDPESPYVTSFMLKTSAPRFAGQLVWREVSCTLSVPYPCCTFICMTLRVLNDDAGVVTVTAADADFVVSASDVATTVTTVEAETVGAVKRPDVEIIPEELDQVTEVFVVPDTVAMNCCF